MLSWRACGPGARHANAAPVLSLLVALPAVVDERSALGRGISRASVRHGPNVCSQAKRVMREPQRVWQLLDTRQRWTFAVLQGLSVVMAFSTLVGLAAIVPFFAVLGDPDEISRRNL